MRLQPFCYLGNSPFDVQLSAVLVLRSIAAAPEASLHLIDSGLIPTLLNLLRTQQEDDEFVLQAWCFLQTCILQT